MVGLGDGLPSRLKQNRMGRRNWERQVNGAMYDFDWFG